MAKARAQIQHVVKDAETGTMYLNSERPVVLEQEHEGVSLHMMQAEAEVLQALLHRAEGDSVFAYKGHTFEYWLNRIKAAMDSAVPISAPQMTAGYPTRSTIQFYG